ncbi:MAG TPA: hypothetical protein VHU80_15020 [Polyangiaceae bacterium]|jgi:hypothetical protein|nr:hypothetical protein [Polyangiaceae bacterium]
MKTALLPLLFLISVPACSDRSVEVGAPLELALSRDGGKMVTIPSCPGTDACMFDSSGKNYRVNGDLPTLHLAPYGTYLALPTDLGQMPRTVSTDGENAGVKVYAAPYNVQSHQCCPEEKETNRVVAEATLLRDGAAVLVLVDDVAPSTQVSVEFDFHELFDTPSTDPRSGYTARFYAESVPALVDPCPGVVDGNIAEACANRP